MDAVDDQRPPGSGRGRAVAGWLVFALLCVTPIFFSLGNHPIHGDSEARYGVVARAMAEGDSPWLVPHYFDRPHLTKPPLTYWLMAGSIKLFGDGELALRLPAALSGGLTLAVVFGLAYRLHGPRRAAIAAAVLSVTPLFVVISRLGITDGPLGLFSTVTLAAGYLAVRERRSRWAVVAWSATALALLTKGPAALVAPGALLLWLLIARPPGGWRALRPWWGLPLAALPLAAWVGWVVAEQPGVWQVWRYELVDRATGDGDHPEPWWFYFPVGFLGLLPATALLLPAAIRHARNRRLNRVRFDPEAKLWLTVLALAFVVFSLISGKLMSYLMPLAGPAAWLSASYLDGLSTAKHIVIKKNPRHYSGLRLLPEPVLIPWFACGGLLLAAELAEDRVYNAHSVPALVDTIRDRTGLDRPQVLTVGLGDRSLPYYTRRPTGWIDPRILPPVWAEMRKDDLVLLADPERWDGFDADPKWDLSDRFARLDFDVPYGHDGRMLRVYRTHPRKR